MIGDHHKLTVGHIKRHVPPASTVGQAIAILDIAQDFLLAHLARADAFDLVVFKGGTALRKLFAGAQGRFSTDMDFAIADVDADRHAVAELIAGQCDVTLGPFTFEPAIRRERWHIKVGSEFGDPEVSIKLDVGPPAWLTPDRRTFVPTPSHARYGFVLPRLPCMALEEVLAEKVARLNRISTARDASDLVWAATTSPHALFDRATVRRLAVLKVWVDNHGLRSCWPPAIAARPFDPDLWLASRDQWDDEQIGLLAHPPPSLTTLEASLRQQYVWLGDLTPDERRWATASAGDRGGVLQALRTLDSPMLSSVSLW